MAKSPARLQSIDTQSPFMSAKKNQRDHIRLVSNERATGKFVSGKSVPRSRPTMFWEHQSRDISFNYEEYMATKDDRDKKHSEKV